MTEQMNSNLGSEEPNKPNFTSFIAALIGIGLLLSTTAVTTVKLESIRVKNELANVGDSKDIIPALIEIVRPRGLAKFLTRDDKLKALTNLRDIELSLKKNEYLEASQKLAALSDSEVLSKKLEIISDKEEGITKLSKEKNEKQNEISIINSDFTSLSSEVSVFFGLDPEENINKEMVFYQNGILQGLPLLKTIPDNIPDVQTFSEKLNEVGGKIEIENTDNPAEVFQQKLDELKDRAFNISLSQSNLLEKLKELERAKAEHEEKKNKDLAEITQFLNELAFSLVKN